MRLRPLRTAPPRTVVGFFDTLAAAGRRRRARHRGRAAARGVRADRPRVPARGERVEEPGLPEDAAALLLAQTDLPEPAGRAGGRAIHAASWRPARVDAMVSTDPVEAEALFDARRLAGPALWGSTRTRCSPRTSACRAAGSPRCSPDRGDRRRARHPDRHHRARGRRQPAPLPDHPEGRRRRPRRALAAFEAIIDTALDLGGTVTGEHGVGLLKRAGCSARSGRVWRCSAR